MASARAPMAMDQLGLGGVLKRYWLRVPANQREYSWDELVPNLFQDLTQAILADEADYFVGAIVTVPRAPETLEIVDGQQRLATTAILLSEIQRYLRPNEPMLADYIKAFLTEINPDERQLSVKLTMNSVDNEFFRAMITRASDSDPMPAASRRSSHKLLVQAFAEARSHVRKVVAGANPRQHGDILNRWVRFIEHGAQVILIRVPSDRNAYKMFETINARRHEATPADLVKNYLFGQAGSRGTEAEEKWALMRGALETVEEDEITVTFLRHALIAMHGHLREPDVYSKVQDV